MILGTFLKLVSDIIQFAGPLLLIYLIDFTENKDQDDIIGYFLAFLLLFTSVIQSIASNHYLHRMLIVGARVRTCLMGLIYKKVKILK